MTDVKVKWGKENYTVTVDTAAPVAVLRAQLQSLTGVPADTQKIMTATGALKDDANLATTNLSKGLMLIGSAAAATAAAMPPAQPVVFAEDVVDRSGHDHASVESNGLENLGNTCYLASAVQTLRVIPELRPLLGKSPNPTASTLNALYRQLDSTKSKVAPAHFLRAFWQAFPEFAKLSDHGHPMQHDAQEALASLVQSVQGLEPQWRAPPAAAAAAAAVAAPVSTDGAAPAAPAAAATAPVVMPSLAPNAVSLMQGIMRESTTCKETGAVTVETLPFVMLPCSIPAEVTTLEGGLERGFTSSFTNPGGADGSPERHFTRKQHITGLPQYLCVHMMRFTWRADSKQKAKILRPVTFPMVLDVSSLCDDALREQLKPQQLLIREYRDRVIEERKVVKRRPGVDAAAPAPAPAPAAAATATPDTALDEDSQHAPPAVIPPPAVSGMYELCAVISHKGRDAEHGHYVAWTKKADHWLVFDDDHVSTVSEEDVKRLKGVGEAHIAYVLLYRAYDPVTGRPPLLI